DAVRGVAGDADRSARRSARPQLAVRAGLELVEDPLVALAAGSRNVLVGDGRFGIRLRKDLVRGVAVGADGGDDEALLERSLAVHAAEVVLDDLRRRQRMALGNGGVGVALRAGFGDAQVVGTRFRIGLREDVVRAVAVGAPRRSFHALRARNGVVAE